MEAVWVYLQKQKQERQPRAAEEPWQDLQDARENVMLKTFLSFTFFSGAALKTKIQHYSLFDC